MLIPRLRHIAIHASIDLSAGVHQQSLAGKTRTDQICNEPVSSITELIGVFVNKRKRLLNERRFDKPESVAFSDA